MWERYRKERLPIAKAALDEFALVGLVEELPASVAALSDIAAGIGLRLPPADDLGHANESYSHLDDVSWVGPSDSVGRRLLASLEEDEELYQHGRLHFEKTARGSKRIISLPSETGDFDSVRSNVRSERVH